MSKQMIPFQKAGLPVSRDDLRAGFKNAVTEKPAVGGMTLLRLVDGEWVYGPENTEVEAESKWAINPASFMHGFVSWLDGSLVGEEMVPIHTPRPAFGNLPNTGAKWQEQVSFVLACVEGEDTGTQVLYKTSSLGGRRAFSEIAQALVNQLEKDENKIVPLVTLDTSSYRHKKYGKVHEPVLNIVAWADLNASSADDAEPQQAKPARKTAKAPAKVEEPVRKRRRA